MYIPEKSIQLRKRSPLAPKDLLCLWPSFYGNEVNFVLLKYIPEICAAVILEIRANIRRSSTVLNEVEILFLTAQIP